MSVRLRHGSSNMYSTCNCYVIEFVWDACLWTVFWGIVIVCIQSLWSDGLGTTIQREKMGSRPLCFLLYMLARHETLMPAARKNLKSQTRPEGGRRGNPSGITIHSLDTWQFCSPKEKVLTGPTPPIAPTHRWHKKNLNMLLGGHLWLRTWDITDEKWVDCLKLFGIWQQQKCNGSKFSTWESRRWWNVSAKLIAIFG